MADSSKTPEAEEVPAEVEVPDVADPSQTLTMEVAEVKVVVVDAPLVIVQIHPLLVVITTTDGLRLLGSVYLP